MGGFTIGDGPKSAKLVYHKTWDSRREPRIQSKNAELREMALRILYDMDEGKLYFARDNDQDIFLVTSSQHQNRIHRIRVVRKLSSFQAGKDLMLARARSALEEKDRVQIDKVEKESSLKLVLRSPIGHPPNDGDVYNPIGIPNEPHPMDYERADCLQQIKKGGFSFCVVEKQYLLEDYAGDGSYRLIIELKSEGDYSSDE